MLPIRSFLPFFALVAASASSFAQTFLDGRVVGTNGVGIAGTNVNIKSIGGGGTPNVLNDGTDANGFFHVTIQQTNANAVYEVTFRPPPPPASTSLETVVSPVNVALNTTVNMGTVTLDPGVSVVGRCVTTLGVGIAGVNIDILDAGGDALTLLDDQTDAAGNFALNAPAGNVTFRFNTTTVVGATIAPSEFPLVLAGSLNLGTQVLQPGFVVSAIVRNSASAGVANVDLDVRDVATQLKLYTPSDSTSATGLVSVIVPAGLFDFEFCPPSASTLAPARVSNVNVAANLSLGIVTLPPGMLLTGSVTNPVGTPLANVNIDLRDAVSDADVYLCNDSTGGGGSYSMRVPAGTYTVKFRPTGAMPYSDDIHYNVAIAATTVLNGQLRLPHLVGCPGDGTLPTACPCGNSGAAGNGCANSVNPLGAHLRGEGATIVNPNTGVESLALVVTGTPSIASIGTIFLQGDAFNAAGSVFGDGVLCAGGQIIRLGSKPTLGGTARYPELGNAAISVRGAVAPGSGLLRWYTSYYRNASAAFCPPATFNASNSVQVTW